MPKAEEQVVSLLELQTGWVEAGYLADALGVTTRSIRNYVKKINNSQTGTTIESSYRGYRLVKSASQASDLDMPSTTKNDGFQRTDFILRKLISTNTAISIYDLADSLYISESTLEAELRHIRDSISLFDLQLERHRDKIFISGSERSKRRLINQMISTESPATFTAFTGNGIMSEGYDLTQITKCIISSLKALSLYADDYGLNNIALHLVVMLDRIKAGMPLPVNSSIKAIQHGDAFHATSVICSELQRMFAVEISDSEIEYLSLIVTSYATKREYSFNEDDHEVATYLDDQDMQLTQLVISRLEDAYYLEPFSSRFVERMALHIHGLLQRIPNGIYARNPLTDKIKNTYPLIYDMACFVIRELANETGLTFSEDEISFIAFHIGAYLENDYPDKSKATCAFIYADYHNMHRMDLDKIRSTFKDSISVIKSIPLSDIDAETLEYDIVFSPVPIDLPKAGRVLVINPLLTEADLDEMRKAISAACARRRGAQAYSMIQRFLNKDQFHYNLYASSKTEMIRELVSLAAKKDLCADSYVQEVLEREELSSTAFGNRLAMPHSMQASTNKSFLSIVVNDRPMDWGGQKVNIIILVGTSKSDRQAFRILFDNVIQVLSEAPNVTKLLKCTTYEQFTDLLNELIMKP